MRLAALASGGKDSIHAAAICDSHGWEVAELMTLIPAERDAWLFHTPNLHLVPLISEAWGKLCSSRSVAGTGEEAELAALKDALSTLPPKGINGVTVGAIGSSYQWSRVWHVAHGLGIEVFAPLWRATPAEVLREEMRSGMDMRIATVASEPLGEDLLGKRIDTGLMARLEELGREVREFHIAGEGGEYETLVLDAPFFGSRIEVLESHVERAGSQAVWVVDRAKLTQKRSGQAGPRTVGKDI